MGLITDEQPRVTTATQEWKGKSEQTENQVEKRNESISSFKTEYTIIIRKRWQRFLCCNGQAMDEENDDHEEGKLPNYHIPDYHIPNFIINLSLPNYHIMRTLPIPEVVSIPLTFTSLPYHLGSRPCHPSTDLSHLLTLKNICW